MCVEYPRPRSGPSPKVYHGLEPVLSKVDDFTTFKKVEVHAENYTF